MPLFLTMCGMPGSGKTTQAIKLSTDNDAKLYCVDDFYSTHKTKSHDEITDLLYASIQEDLDNGNNVVCDGTYATEFVRLRLLDSLANVPCRKIIVVMDTPLDECLRRNADRKKSTGLCDKDFCENIQITNSF